MHEQGTPESEQVRVAVLQKLLPRAHLVAVPPLSLPLWDTVLQKVLPRVHATPLGGAGRGLGDRGGGRWGGGRGGGGLGRSSLRAAATLVPKTVREKVPVL